MQDLERLVSLATVVRKAFEKYAAKTKYFPSDLCGLCYDASLTLMRLAKRHGIEKAQLGVGIGHWFVLLDNMVVDVTSTQFGQPDKVAVLPLEHAEKIGTWWELQGKQDEATWEDSQYTMDGTALAEELLENGGIGEGEL